MLTHFSHSIAQGKKTIGSNVYCFMCAFLAASSIGIVVLRHLDSSFVFLITMHRETRSHKKVYTL